MITSNAAFKKQVRALAAQESIPYAEARSRLLGAKGPKSGADNSPKTSTADGSLTVDAIAPLIGGALIARAIELAAADSKLDDAERAWVEAREQEGLRVVEGGQTGQYDADGKTPWEVQDWRTQQTLATGVSTYEEMTWEDDWIDISAAVSDGALNGVDLYHDTEVLDALPDDTAPQLHRFIERLVAAMDSEDWPREFGDWVHNTSTTSE